MLANSDTTQTQHADTTRMAGTGHLLFFTMNASRLCCPATAAALAILLRPGLGEAAAAGRFRAPAGDLVAPAACGACLPCAPPPAAAAAPLTHQMPAEGAQAA